MLFRNIFLLFGFCVVARAAQLPAEQLLPAETQFMLTVKDWESATNAFWKSSMGRLWMDEAMRPTREKFNAHYTNDVAARLERDVQLKLSDYTELAQGQITFAMTKSAEEGKPPGFLLLIDAKEKSEILKIRLGDLQKKWSEAGRQVKTEKIRDIDFTTYQFTKANLQKFARSLSGRGEEVEPDPDAEASKINLIVGQSQSLLLIGTQTRDLEKIVAKQSGAGVPTLSEDPVFQGNYNTVFRDSGIYAWLDFRPIFELLSKSDRNAAAQNVSGIANLRMDRLIPAVGLGELKSIAAKFDMTPDGYQGEIFLTAPESSRQGLLKILAAPAKDVSPPPFVPADAISFQRTRIDFQQVWSAVEGVLARIDPSVAGVVQLMLNAAGKDKDPNFDLKKSLLDNLGDDYISYEKPARDGEAPGLTLIGARNADEVINGVKTVMRMFPEPIGTAQWKEREFLGRKINTLSLGTNGLSVCASGGYVAITSNSAILEDFLRSSETPPKPLRDLPGLADAAQKVGGYSGGYWFSWEDQAEAMRMTIEREKIRAKDPEESPNITLGLSTSESVTRILPEFIDYTTLPAFDRIAKYFYFTLWSGSANPGGISMKWSIPTPPALK